MHAGKVKDHCFCYTRINCNPCRCPVLLEAQPDPNMPEMNICYYTEVHLEKKQDELFPREAFSQAALPKFLSGFLCLNVSSAITAPPPPIQVSNSRGGGINAALHKISDRHSLKTAVFPPLPSLSKHIGGEAGPSP